MACVCTPPPAASGAESGRRGAPAMTPGAGVTSSRWLGGRQAHGDSVLFCSWGSHGTSPVLVTLAVTENQPLLQGSVGLTPTMTLTPTIALTPTMTLTPTDPDPDRLSPLPAGAPRAEAP